LAGVVGLCFSSVEVVRAFIVAAAKGSSLMEPCNFGARMTALRTYCYVEPAHSFKYFLWNLTLFSSLNRERVGFLFAVEYFVNFALNLASFRDSSQYDSSSFSRVVSFL
jgi:hypothetical protein